MFKFLLIGTACITLTACINSGPYNSYTGQTVADCQSNKSAHIAEHGFTNIRFPSRGQYCKTLYFIANDSSGRAVEGYYSEDPSDQRAFTLTVLKFN